MSPKTMANKINFAFFGTPELASVFLDDLERAGLVPSLIVTTPDRPQGRGMVLTAPPVKQWGLAHGVPVMQPETLDESFARELGTHFDVFVVIYYGKILPRAVFSVPKHGTINVHFSLLPRWRGTSPVRAAILNDDKRIGTSLLLMDEKVDHGPIVAQKELTLPEWPPKATVIERLATHESAKLLIDVIGPYVRGEIEAHEQNHDLETRCPKFEKKDGALDLADDAYQNLLKIRAFDSSIGTYALFERGGKTIRVQILDAHLDGGKLVIDYVKPEGKGVMSYEDFARSGARPVNG